MSHDLLMSKKYAFKRNLKVKGFTLLELMITLGILAIVLTIAIPNFQRISINGNLRTAARDLIADFNALRAKAIAENTQYVLTFNGDNTYTVNPASGLPNGGKSPASIARDITISGVPFAGGPVTFSTRGTVSPGGNVVLTNSRGSTATITCNLSGRTYVQFTMY